MTYPSSTMVDGLLCYASPGTKSQIITGIGITVKLGKVAGSNINTNAMTWQKYIGSASHFDIIGIVLIGSQQFHLIQPLPKPRS